MSLKTFIVKWEAQLKAINPKYDVHYEVSKEEPITFKEYNWSEQRAQREMQDHFAQQKQVDNTMINGEIISKKENNNESKS